MEYLEKWGTPERDRNKYTLDDYILAYNNLPEGTTKSIPLCLYNDSGILVPAVLRVLAWVMVRRSKPKATVEDVGKRINGANIAEAVREVWYFWSEMTREEQEEQIQAAEKLLAAGESQEEEGAAKPDPLA